LLADAGVETPADLAGLRAERLNALGEDWMGLTGQSSGLSWDYVRMLAGLEGVKPDRMLRRFVAGAAPRWRGPNSTGVTKRHRAPSGW
jgi:hypothetical protein